MDFNYFFKLIISNITINKLHMSKKNKFAKQNSNSSSKKDRKKFKRQLKNSKIMQKNNNKKIFSKKHYKKKVKIPITQIEFSVLPKNNAPLPPKKIPKWIPESTLSLKDPYLKFHQELIDYAYHIEPKESLLDKRSMTLKLFMDIIKDKYPQWDIKTFGSYAQGTQTIFSDLDLVIFKKEKEHLTDYEMLKEISQWLRRKQFGYNIQFIKARVPIIKVICQKTGISIDISVNRSNGYEAAQIIRKKLEEIAVLKPIILFLKILLRVEHLNEAHIGGMSSFLLFSLVFFYYQRIVKNHQAVIDIEPGLASGSDQTETDDDDSKVTESNKKGKHISRETLEQINKNINNAKFLLGFLKFYGIVFNYKESGISLRNGGEFYYKVERDDMECSELLSVENFQDQNNDIGRSCFCFEKIRWLFKKTYQILEEKLKKNQLSFLASLNLP